MPLHLNPRWKLREAVNYCRWAMTVCRRGAAAHRAQLRRNLVALIALVGIRRACWAPICA